MTEPLKDIRVGDIMVLSAGTEVVVARHLRGDLWAVREYPAGCVSVHAEADELRNPVFRVGDKVRFRGATGADLSEWFLRPNAAHHKWALVERVPVSDAVKQKQQVKADFIIEAWKQWPEHKDDGSCTARDCGVCALDKAEDTVPDNKPFVKHDDNKPRMDLLPPLALKAMARVLTLGAAKYGDTNWRNIPREERSRLVASLLRHVTAAMAGEDMDPESGESHWAHAASNAAFLCELFEMDKIAEDKFRR